MLIERRIIVTVDDKDASMICENLNTGLLRQLNILQGISRELRHGKGEGQWKDELTTMQAEAQVMQVTVSNTSKGWTV